MPPSPCTGSMMIAAVCGPIAARAASRLSGTMSKPSSSGPKPSVCFLLPAAEIVAIVRPWKLPSNVTIRWRASPFPDQYLRAILMASSIASAPELQKKTVSPKVASTSRAASRCCPGTS